MSEVNEGSGMSIVVAAVIGAAVGAGVALLWAPCSGRETREWLANRTREIKDGTKLELEHGKDAVRRVAKEIGKEIGKETEEVANAGGRPSRTELGSPTMRL